MALLEGVDDCYAGFWGGLLAEAVQLGADGRKGSEVRLTEVFGFVEM